MLKCAGEPLVEAIAELFDDVIQCHGEVPARWKETRLRVLFKSGDARCPDNYWPISILPILLKLFSRVMHARIADLLTSAQSHDQAGFRGGYSCDDHLFTLTLLHEKCSEWEMPFWIAAIDFRKAFDTVEREELWSASQEQQIPAPYICALRRLCTDQTGTIVEQKQSRPFSITRCTTQGDPISSPLFNAVFEKAMAKVKRVWIRRGLGIQVSSFNKEEKLLNLRFADNVLLVAKSLQTQRSMMVELREAVGEVGLQMHMGKTIILANDVGKQRKKASDTFIGEEKVWILPTAESTKYLGRALCFENPYDQELTHKITSGWPNLESTELNYAIDISLCIKGWSYLMP